MRGKERFSAPGRVSALISRFSAGDRRTPWLKAHSKIDSFSAGLQSSSHLLKQGASTKSLPLGFPADCELRPFKEDFNKAKLCENQVRYLPAVPT